MRLVSGPVARIAIQDITGIFFGYPYKSVAFVRGSYVSGPAEGTIRARDTVPAGYRGAVVVVLLDATEPNYFDIEWVSGGAARTYRVRLPSDGVLVYDFRPGLNLDAPADENTEIRVKNVNVAMVGTAYKVDLLVGLW